MYFCVTFNPPPLISYFDHFACLCIFMLFTMFPIISCDFEFFFICLYFLHFTQTFFTCLIFFCMFLKVIYGICSIYNFCMTCIFCLFLATLYYKIFYFTHVTYLSFSISIYCVSWTPYIPYFSFIAFSPFVSFYFPILPLFLCIFPLFIFLQFPLNFSYIPYGPYCQAQAQLSWAIFPLLLRLIGSATFPPGKVFSLEKLDQASTG